MEILVENQQRKISLNLPKIKTITRAILKFEHVKVASLSIVFVSSQKIKAINKKYLRRNYVTDVLAFDLKEGGPGLCGDIIISTETAQKNAREYKTSVSYECGLYIIHGILHLKGYDDHGAANKKRMHRREQKVIDHLGSKINKICK